MTTLKACCLSTAAVISILILSACENPQEQTGLPPVEQTEQNIVIEERGYIQGPRYSTPYAVWVDKKTGARILITYENQPVLISPRAVEGH